MSTLNFHFLAPSSRILTSLRFAKPSASHNRLVVHALLRARQSAGKSCRQGGGTTLELTSCSGQLLPRNTGKTTDSLPSTTPPGDASAAADSLQILPSARSFLLRFGHGFIPQPARHPTTRIGIPHLQSTCCRGSSGLGRCLQRAPDSNLLALLKAQDRFYRAARLPVSARVWINACH